MEATDREVIHATGAETGTGAIIDVANKAIAA